MCQPGEDYDLFCELNPCPECGGGGTIDDDGHGERTCRHCDGSGIDPNATYEGDAPL
jgi:DnaJ-class molecular chaperone